MKIEKNGIIYEVTESAKVWTLATKIGCVPVQYTVSKADCPTFEALESFIAECSAQ